MKTRILSFGSILVLLMSFLGGSVYADTAAQTLRYNYSGAASLRTGPISHTSAPHSYGTNFDVYYTISCTSYDSTDNIEPKVGLTFYSNTLHRTWESRSVYNTSTTKSLSVSGHWHSNIAQNLTMTFNATLCSYTVKIYQ